MLSNPLAEIDARPMPADTIQALWLSGFVRRWHSNDDWRLRESGEINGGHTQRVAILYACLFEPTVEGLLSCLLHDVGEVLSGDISAPAKRRVPMLGMGDKEASQIYFDALDMQDYGVKSPEVGLCDLLDAIMYAKYRAPELMARPDWIGDRGTCEAMAEALGVHATVCQLMDWDFVHMPQRVRHVP